MPNEIFLLILLAVGILAVVDVFLGGASGPGGDWASAGRISWREFATRPLPIFLFGVGAAMLPARVAAGASLLVLGGVLALLGKYVPGRCAGCGEGA